MQLRPTLLGIFFTTVIMASCSAPRELEFKEYNSVSIDKMGFSNSTIKMNLVYFNPNNFGLELKRTELDIFINDVFLGHSSQELQVAIPRKNNFTLPLKIDVDMKNLLKNGISTLFNKEVAVRATGTIKLGKAGVYKNFKVNYQGKQQLSLF